MSVVGSEISFAQETNRIEKASISNNFFIIPKQKMLTKFFQKTMLALANFILIINLLTLDKD